MHAVASGSIYDVKVAIAAHGAAVHLGGEVAGRPQHGPGHISLPGKPTARLPFNLTRGGGYALPGLILLVNSSYTH